MSIITHLPARSKLLLLNEARSRVFKLKDKGRLKEEAEGSLVAFVRLMWPFVEPARPLVEGWPLDAICEHLEAVTSGEITRLLINVPPGFMKSLVANVFWPAWEWIDQPSLRYISASYSAGLTVRDNGRLRNIITSDLYQQLWGDSFGAANGQDSYNVTKLANDRTGWKLATSVSGLGTGERADRFVVDDGNSVAQAESEAVIKTTSQWFREVVPTRLNDQEKSVIINIQQRTGEEDISGIILDPKNGFQDYVHLMIPMEYEPERHYVTVIGWEDPRGKDPETRFDNVGALAWPKRFPRKVVERDKAILGEYGCTPYESPILMRDLSMKPIGAVEVGDDVVGFTTSTDARRPGDRFARRRLMTAKVIGKQSLEAPVVKITLDSGRVIRCTADHKWYTGRGTGQGRPLYLPPELGRSLIRVCEPELPQLTPEQQRSAAWLAGFFDGDGSVSMHVKADGHEPSSSICFYQGAGRNLPLCDALELALTDLDFEYTIIESMRPDKTTLYAYRQYRLKTRNRLVTHQRFLHLVKPNKWRNRIIDGALTTRMCVQREKVVSIEPDGVETVYSLETTAGNYVVWGIASSNSAGQFQQRPAPRGGGIFKREHWREWPPADWPADQRQERVNFPPLEYVIASLDTALGEKDESDYSALTIWGIWRGAGGDKAKLPPRIVIDPASDFMRLEDAERPKCMLLYGWEKRLRLHGPTEDVPAEMTKAEWNSPARLIQRQKNWGLVQWVVFHCRKFRVDTLLIEVKANGKDVADELERLHKDEDWGTVLVDPGRFDKVSRAYALQHLFENGIVYAPLVYSLQDDRWDYPAWAAAIVDQFSIFPRGKHDDLVDSGMHALKHMRDLGLLVRSDEAEKEYDRSLEYTRRLPALYPA